VDSQIEFVECPAYVDDDGTLRCGLPAEVLDRFSLWSTDGWLAAAVIACPVNHRFSAPLDALHVPDCPKRSDQSRPGCTAAPRATLPRAPLIAPSTPVQLLWSSRLRATAPSEESP